MSIFGYVAPVTHDTKIFEARRDARRPFPVRIEVSLPGRCVSLPSPIVDPQEMAPRLSQLCSTFEEKSTSPIWELTYTDYDDLSTFK
jgi:hypothetical protein